jgi:hypothetical protein
MDFWQYLWRAPQPALIPRLVAVLIIFLQVGCVTTKSLEFISKFDQGMVQLAFSRLFLFDFLLVVVDIFRSFTAISVSDDGSTIATVIIIIGHAAVNRFFDVDVSLGGPLLK